MQSNRSSWVGAKHSVSLVAVCVCLTIVAVFQPSKRMPSTVNAAQITPSEVQGGEPQRLMADADALRAQWKEAQLREAVVKYDKAATTFTSASDLSNAALATLRAGDVCFDLSEFREALKRYEHAATLANKADDRLAEGRALSNLGRVNSYMGNNDLAQTNLNKALGLLKLPDSDPTPAAQSAYGEALANAGEVSYSKGNFAKAFDQFIESIRYLDHDRRTQARAHRFIGYISGSLGNGNRALSEITQAQKLSAEANDKSGEGLALTLLGLFYSFTGEVEAAMDLHQKAIDIFHSIGDRHSEAVALNGIGQVYWNLRQFENAQLKFEESLRLLESVGALDLVAVTAFKLATVHVVKKEHAQALVYFERCLALSRAAGKVRNEMNLVSEIAMVYADQNRPDKAVTLFREVQRFYEKIHDVRGQAIALNNYGDFLLLKPDQKEQALNVYTRALSLSGQVGDPDILNTTIYNLARVHHALGNYDVALSWIERSLRMIEDLRAGLGTPDWRAVYLSHAQEEYGLCIQILMDLERVRPGNGFSSRAFLMSEKRRARSLLDLVRESQSRSQGGPTGDLLRREREVSGMLRSIAENQLSSPPSDPTQAKQLSDRVIQLQIDYQQIQAELRKQQPKQLRLPEFELKDIEQVQQVLRPNDAMLLEYSLGKERSFLWVVTANSFQGYQLPSRRELENAAVEVYNLLIARQEVDPVDSDYQAKVEQAENEFPAKARALSQLLLGPVADQLGNNRTLVLVKEGALQLIPFEALPPPPLEASHAADSSESTAPSYLVQTNEIVALPSMSTLLAMRAADKRSASPGKVVAVIADPVFSNRDDRVQIQKPSSIAHAAGAPGSNSPIDAGLLSTSGLPRLVHASEEADAISGYAPYATAMVAKGFDANRETAMNPDLGEYQIVHFATHGMLNTVYPELSGIVLTMVDENGAHRDGLMPLNDIYSLDLSAQLTVLSACTTALGKDVNGEGVVGLTHGFISAGSKSVVASLWKVDDRATSSLMSKFYESMLKEGLRPSAALRDAKLKMIKDNSAPYYWAGFVFQGDYETRIVVEGRSHLFVGLALLLLVLISCGLIVLLRHRRRSSPAER
ncbi:MAG TPA: CHAT domain-containing protein [Pyrinomonadaceae bacterium]|nr:CHAT domain-containing protein [Pyrinomonadaceae bacterium]